jgi:hypothetical protein
MGKARNLVCSLAAWIALCALGGAAVGAAGSEPEPARPGTAAELRSFCLTRMNIERSAHPRGAPNWSIYDRCMKRNGGR